MMPTRSYLLPATRSLCRVGTGRVIAGHSLWNPQHLLGKAQRRQLPNYHVRIPGASRSLATQIRSGKRVFAEDDIPPLEFWKQSVVGGTLTPEDCHEVVRKYCELAKLQESTWKGKLERDHKISPETLHSLAIILVSGPPSPLWRLGLHMLATASDLGFTLSTLLLIRLMRQSDDTSKVSGSTLFRNALARFQDIVRQRQDPDALTLQGLILADQGDSGKALASFDQALRIGSSHEPKGPIHQETTLGRSLEADPGSDHGTGESDPQPKVRPFRWSWEASCHIGRAKILLQQGRRDEAVAAMRIAALELDNMQGYFELAKMLPEDAPERVQYLQTAAVSGHLEACRLLGESEVQMAREPGRSKGDAQEHSLWASEWFSLAGDVEKSAGARWAFAS